MRRIARQGRFHFTVDLNVDLDTLFGLPLQYLIQSPFLIVVRRPAHKQLGRQPPVSDVDGLFGVFQCHRHSLISVNLHLQFLIRRKEIVRTQQ